MEPLTDIYVPDSASGKRLHSPGQQRPGGFQRRDVLKAVAAWGLSFALPGLESRAANERGAERPRSLILLWLQGGPSQLETWDPHPGKAIGGDTQAIKTRIPDASIAHFYPRVAEQIDCLSVVRSLVSKEGDHERATYLLKTGYRPDPTLIHPSLGAILAHELPVAGVEIPRHISILDSQWPGRGGYLGDEYDAFKMFDPSARPQNTASRTSQDRQQRRLRNLEQIEQSFKVSRPVQADRTLHGETVRRALAMMSSEQLRAFEIDDEPLAVREAYGLTPFGRGCLAARRLVEIGVRAVEVNLGGFDSHAKNFSAHEAAAGILDPALAALLQDLRSRDLLASTAVLCIGEFGRTPQINPLDGRDHWPSGFSCLIGGAGLQAGRVLGKTDHTGKEKEPKDPVEVADLYATLLHVLGVDFSREVLTPIGRPMRLNSGKPLAQLLPS